MSEPLQTANAVEPDPIPDDLSREAPIKGDIERGYVRDDGVYSTSREGVTAGGEVDRNGSSATAAVDERRGSGAVLEQKKRKSKGSGLTEGDEGECIPFPALLSPCRVTVCIDTLNRHG